MPWRNIRIGRAAINALRRHDRLPCGNSRIPVSSNTLPRSNMATLSQRGTCTAVRNMDAGCSAAMVSSTASDRIELTASRELR